MTRHRRLKQRIRNSPARQARQRHSRAQRLVTSLIAETRERNWPFTARMPPVWLVARTAAARPRGPKYAEGDCRRNPQWRRRGSHG